VAEGGQSEIPANWPSRLLKDQPVQRIKQWARTIKRDVIAIWIASRNAWVPWYAKVVAAAVRRTPSVPSNLIPDFVPVLGQLDDLLIVPLRIRLTIHLIPNKLTEEFRAELFDGNSGQQVWPVPS
jgi:uncharacterized membrane protein YkvA (DUF1232 family)